MEARSGENDDIREMLEEYTKCVSNPHQYIIDDDPGGTCTTIRQDWRTLIAQPDRGPNRDGGRSDQSMENTTPPHS